MRYRRRREFDRIVAGLLLALLWPLFVMVAIAITLESKGPVFFRQTRIGGRPQKVGQSLVWDVEPFRVFKFRSMSVTSNESIHAEHIRNYVTGRLKPADGRSFKLQDDDRVTAVGRILRRTSIDELPQLINVVRGEMSLVGPRPVPDYEVALYKDWHRERLLALPGITGVWQVHGRGRVTFEEMVRMDIDYVRNNTFLGDLKLIALTLPAVISRNGAE